MNMLSSALSEYETGMSLYGIRHVMCSHLIAEIGDVRRFERSKPVGTVCTDYRLFGDKQVDVRCNLEAERATLYRVQLVTVKRSHLRCTGNICFRLSVRRKADMEIIVVVRLSAENRFPLMDIIHFLAAFRYKQGIRSTHARYDCAVSHCCFHTIVEYLPYIS